MLQAELNNLNDIYTSYKPIIIPAVKLLAIDPSFDGNSNYNRHVRRNLLPFLGNALSWITGNATAKDINTIKKRVNQLISAQSAHQEAIVYIVSILNITRYTLSTSLSYFQLVFYIGSVLANLWDSLSSIRTVSMHTMDYTDRATTGTLSPHILPIADLKHMLSHIEETLPPTMHLPMSPEDTLYTFIDTYVLTF